MVSGQILEAWLALMKISHVCDGVNTTDNAIREVRDLLKADFLDYPNCVNQNSYSLTSYPSITAVKDDCIGTQL